MPRLTPQHWKTLEDVFTKDGFVLEREEGSHRVYSKPGCARPVIIPKYSEVGVEIIQSNMRTAGMGREKYFQLLSESKKR
jgi:predicted RNA binding protein YcfA (HicA-like mRNA interferase family)